MSEDDQPESIEEKCCMYDEFPSCCWFFKNGINTLYLSKCIMRLGAQNSIQYYSVVSCNTNINHHALNRMAVGLGCTCKQTRVPLAQFGLGTVNRLSVSD